MNSIRDNISRVRERVALAAEKAGRSPEEIVLVAVTKNVEAGRIVEAVEAGITELGENRVQEAREKIRDIRERSSLVPRLNEVKWHLVGHLQRNKVKYVLSMFGLIQSLDSRALADELNARAEALGVVVPVLVQINSSREPTKYGIASDEAFDFVCDVSKLAAIRIQGLMTIGPLLEPSPRPAFAETRKLFEYLAAQRIPGVEMRYLSMGMTDDFEIAIQEGSNMVRIGRAIFGSR